MNTFTSWDTELCHHGIKGMKWGVRRYQNEDGSLTAAGRSRYGDGDGDGQKHVSARKIGRDFNSLEQGYANAVARRNRANYVGEKLSRKALKRGMTPEQAATGTDRLSRKMQKVAKRQAKAEKDMASIESLQRRVLAKADKEGYTITSRIVTRYGQTGSQVAAGILGGAAGILAINAFTKGTVSSAVGGYKIKAHK